MKTKQNPLSAGVIPILREKRVLYLILRSYNYWDFPKGGVEQGETPLQAARRELLEETGIEEIKILAAEEFTETPPYSRGKIARYYLGEVFSKEVFLGINEELGRAEHQEYRWVTAEEAEELFVPRLKDVLHWAEQKLKLLRKD